MFKAALPFKILFRMGNSTSSSLGKSATAPVNQIQVSDVGDVGKHSPLWKKNCVLHIEMYFFSIQTNIGQQMDY